MSGRKQKGFIKTMPLSLVTVLVTGLFLFSAMNLQTVPSVYAAVPTGTLTGTVQTLTAGTNAAINTLTVTDVSPAEITAAHNIRIKIPDAANFIWDTADTTPTFGGTASGKVAAAVIYLDSRTLHIDVTTDFANNDTLTVSDISYVPLAATSATALTWSIDSGANYDTGNANTSVTVNAANASAAISLANATVGAVQNTTLTLFLPTDLASGDTITWTMPNNIEVAGTAFVSTTFKQSDGATTATFSGCSESGQLITCTSSSTVDNTSGNIYMSGMSAIYDAAITNEVTDLAVHDTSAGGADIATDTDVDVTDTTAADAGAYLTLGGNSVVGATGNSTLTITVPVDMANADTISFDAPANLQVSGVAFVSKTFTGAGTFSSCSAVGQTVTCTANGVITAGTGNIVMNGGMSRYAATGQTITNIVITDTSAGANTASDDFGTVTPTTPANANASVVQANPTVGAVGSTTLDLTLPFAMDADDTIDITFPASFDVSNIGSAVTGTFESSANITCVPFAQVVTCTAHGSTMASGTIIMTGITTLYADTTNVTNVEVENEGNTTEDIATDTSVATTDIAAANANASVVQANPTVGAVGSTTLDLTLPFVLANTDTIDITFPAYYDISGVASAVTGTLENTDSITCVDAGSQVVTCTTSAATNTSGTIIMTGITSYYAGTTDIADLQVEAAGVAANDIATDITVATTDIAAADAAATVTLGTNSVVGTAGDTSINFTLPRALVAGDTVEFSLPANLNITGLDTTDAVQSFGGTGTFDCTAATPMVCTADGAVSAGTGTITLTGITAAYAATGVTLTDFEVEDQGVAANDIAVDTSVAVDDTTAADAVASVVMASPAVGAAGNTTVTLTLPIALANTDTVDITFPLHINAYSVAFASETFGGTGTFGSCSYAGGNVVTCTANGVITAGTGDIVMTGITNSYVATTDITSLEVEQGGTPANDIATDTTVALTDAIAAALTGTSVSVSHNVVNSTVVATINMTLANILPANGKIVVVFPAGFNVTGATSVVSASGFTASETFSALGFSLQTVTLTRNGTGVQIVGGSTISFGISSAVNPGVSGTAGPFYFSTTTNGDATIDQDATVSGVSIIDAVTTTTPTPSGGGGGGGGGGGASTSTTSNSTTTTSVAKISTITGNQAYSSPMQFAAADITVDTANNTASARLTGDGTLTLRPNSKAAISTYFPANTTVTGPADWNGKIDPPVTRSLTMISQSGEPIEGTSDLLMRDDVTAIVKVGANVPLQFSNEVTLEIPLDLPDGSVVLLYTSYDGNNWKASGEGVVRNGKLIVKTDHFTYFAMAPTDETRVSEAQHEAAPEGFTDIIGHWAKTYIDKIAATGIVQGKTPTQFAPDDNISRAEILKIAVNAFGFEIPESLTEKPLPDVEINAWYAPYIKAAFDNNIIYGFENGIGPDTPASRGLAATILAKAAGFTDIQEQFEQNYLNHTDWTYARFPDVPMENYYAPFVAYLYDKGVISGYENNTFGPGSPITRAEIAKIVVKIMELQQ